MCYMIVGFLDEAICKVKCNLSIILLQNNISISNALQYGFKLRRTTGNVYEDKVFYAGNHFVGPDYDFKRFKATAHFEVFDAVTVFTLDRLQVSTV